MKRGAPAKGAAADMPARSAPKGEGAPLNFRVPLEFRRRFKPYAAAHDLKLNELLRRSFEAYAGEE